MMTGMRRKRTDNNSLILWPSGKKRKDGIRKDTILFPLFTVPFYTSCSWDNVLCSVSVCVWLCTLEYSQSPQGFAGLNPKSVCVRFYHMHIQYVYMACMCVYCMACICWHASLAFVYIFIYLFIVAPVLKHICLLSVTRLDVLLGVFLFRAIWVQ